MLPLVATAPTALDPQMESVYRLDALWWASCLHLQGITDYQPLSLKACATLVNQELAKYSLTPVSVLAERTANSPEALQAVRLGHQNSAGTNGQEMFLPTAARNPIYVLHETAHAILIQSDLDDNHGPIFMRLYIELLIDRLQADRSALLSHARSQGVKVARRRSIARLLLLRRQLIAA